MIIKTTQSRADNKLNTSRVRVNTNQVHSRDTPKLKTKLPEQQRLYVQMKILTFHIIH